MTGRTVTAVAAALISLSGALLAQTAVAPPPAADGPSLALSLEAAQGTIDACARNGYKVAVTVLDSAGVSKVILAADGVGPAAIASSTKKATTAMRLDMSTIAAVEQAKTDQALAAKIAADPSLFVHAGGILLMSAGKVIGAIGASGAPHEGHQDDICLDAGIAKIKDRLN
jgi:uncharacterized protein GlcG (DUF336 family)